MGSYSWAKILMGNKWTNPRGLELSLFALFLVGFIPLKD